ncbi:universal minicircle sequence binding protein [Leishmania donovani]|uniref:Universal minicircle sequence binding protein n=1 Tax=Leishmania donovani TaxID=5661 RepID=A0A3Q8IK17_LEIDO|nr:universal minicircle sequence binding protein [Leishmania donovani]
MCHTPFSLFLHTLLSFTLPRRPHACTCADSRLPESFTALSLSLARSLSLSHSFHSPPSIIMSAITCYKCGEAGHMSRSCPRAAATRSCYNCGETGHMSRDCPSERKPKSCYNCGSTDHLSRECTNEAKAGADTRSCYNCGGTGHLSRDCPNERKPKSCYNCGSTDHLSRECPDRH